MTSRWVARTVWFTASLTLPVTWSAGPDPSYTTGSSMRDALSGVTRDAHGQALPFVDIKILPAIDSAAARFFAAAQLTVKSDASGKFLIAGLLPGTYRIVAEKGGYTKVVGQINTALSGTFDVVLHPTGPAGPAGTKPEDSSWVLRLPARDRLEQREFTVAEALSPSASTPQDWPITFQISHVQLDADQTVSGGSSGMSLGVRAAHRVGPGNGSLEARYGALGDSTRFNEEDTVLSSRWDGAQGGAVGWGIGAFVGRHQRLRTPSDAAARFESDRHSAGVDATLTLTSSRRRDEFRFDAQAMRGSETADRDSPFEARWVAGRWAMELGLPEHTLQARVAAQSAAGAWRGDAQDQPTAALVSLPVISDATSLGSVAGGGIDAAVSDRWQFAPQWRLSSATRGVYRGGFEHGPQASGAVGLDWNALPWLAMQAQVGVVAGDSPEHLIWSGAMSGTTYGVSWTIGRSHETGATPWRDVGYFAPVGTLLIVDASGVIDRWSVGVESAGRGWIPGIQIHGDDYRIDGRTAARLPGDRWLVPIAAVTDAKGRQLEVGIVLPASGTTLKISWSAVDTPGGTTLLGGADRWVQTAVAVRQQLAALSWRGTSAHLLLSVEDGAATGRTGGGEVDAARLALLDQRRLSGGLALTF